MESKPNQPQTKQLARPEDSRVDSWNPDSILDTLMNNQDKFEQDWVETGLPKLVDTMIANYQTFGGMDHLEGRDLAVTKSGHRSFRRKYSQYFSQVISARKKSPKPT